MAPKHLWLSLAHREDRTSLYILTGVAWDLLARAQLPPPSASLQESSQEGQCEKTRGSPNGPQYCPSGHSSLPYPRRPPGSFPALRTHRAHRGLLARRGPLTLLLAIPEPGQRKPNLGPSLVTKPRGVGHRSHNHVKDSCQENREHGTREGETKKDRVMSWAFLWSRGSAPLPSPLQAGPRWPTAKHVPGSVAGETSCAHEPVKANHTAGATESCGVRGEAPRSHRPEKCCM